MSTEKGEAPEFDSFADNYSEALHQGLSLTGETQEYFAAERIRLLARRLEAAGRKTSRVLDFGCGQGHSTSLLRSALNAQHAVGADVSLRLLDVARNTSTDAAVSYTDTAGLPDIDPFDCVYMSGVLHHVPVIDRPAVLKQVYDCLNPGGIFALCENNPWNPGTRFVMNKIPFDRDAKTLTIPESRALLRAAGFSILGTNSHFFFPRALRLLRPLESFLSPTFLGGQYMVLAIRGA
jgi:SAM-dependent methyltransferase